MRELKYNFCFADVNSIILVLCRIFNSSSGKSVILIIRSNDKRCSDTDFQGNKLVVRGQLNLELLAKNCAFYTNAFMTTFIFLPIRAGLLAERYQQRFKHEFNPLYNPLNFSEGVPFSKRLCPEYFTKAKYIKGRIGKRYLGWPPSHISANKGVDETFGFIGEGYNYNKWTSGIKQCNLPIGRKGKTIKVTSHLNTSLGVEVYYLIHNNQRKSWFLWLTFSVPNAHHQPQKECVKTFPQIKGDGRHMYLAQISMLDDAVGKVFNTSKGTGRIYCILVFFLSDNGGSKAHGTDNQPLSGGKSKLYEGGGIRLSLIISRSKKLRKEIKYDLLNISLDIYCTTSSLIGIKQSSNEI